MQNIPGVKSGLGGMIHSSMIISSKLKNGVFQFLNLHGKIQEIKQGHQEACVDEQKSPDESQIKKGGIQELEAE